MCKIIYNHFLDKSKNKGYIKAFDMCNEIKKLYAQYPFLKEADSLSKICLLLKWKAELLGKYYYQVDTYYPSSKKYSHCDNKTDKTNNLSVRNSPCEVCGNEND